MVLIDRIFNEEQLLLETFFPKMHIERDIRKKVILKKAPGGGARVLICSLGYHSRTFSALFPTYFANLFPHLLRA